MFLSRLNRTQRITTSEAIKIMEMSSSESPYFKSQIQEECKANGDATHNSRQTRSATSKQASAKIKLDASAETSEPLHAKTKKIRKKMAVSVEENITSEQISWMPQNWETVLNNICSMRKARDAPVDHMGAEKCVDEAGSPEIKRFQVLCSLMLSSQTKDQVTFAAMEKLRKHGLTIENMIKTDENVIAELIHPVGFWKKKASYIKRTAQILAEKYNSDIPKSVEELCTLPGVGQKMAVLTVNIGWEKTVGIGVDTHVHRIANRLGWTLRPSKTPENTQKELEDWVPRTLWNEVNVLLVGFGQQRCTPVKPQCSTCWNKDLCPVGKSQVHR